MSIYVTSDLHFNHLGILRTCRPQFKTVEEHNEFVIKNYNSVVGKDDLVYILGDLGFTPIKDLKPLVSRLNGRKILVLGNHDKGTVGEYRAMGFIEVYDHPLYYSKNIILSHEPIKEALDNPYVYNIHGHLHKSKLKLPNYININIDETDFLPVSLKKLQLYVNDNTKTRREAFMAEWYAEYYQKD